MAAVDSTTLIAFVQGDAGIDVEQLDHALVAGNLYLPQVVLVEVLCQPNLPSRHADLIKALPVLTLSDGYWLRAAETRGRILTRRLRARLPDVLIAQSCIDHDVPLITRDPDFRHFAKYCGLKLA